MTLANKITISRIILIPVVMTFLLSPGVLGWLGINFQWGAIAAGAVFILAALTDTLDGYLARSRDEITVLGQILDPLADKLLISAALISLVSLGNLSAWVAVVIIGREFAVTGLRMAAAVRHVVIPASGWGKTKTVFQIVAITFLIVQPSIPHMSALFAWALLGLEWALIIVALALTIFSGLDYFIKSYSTLFVEEEV
jgi:CDP-diacylglycerol---glycerol-3-phosphate 3-phosphatidyltransferase